MRSGVNTALTLNGSAGGRQMQLFRGAFSAAYRYVDWRGDRHYPTYARGTNAQPAIHAEWAPDSRALGRIMGGCDSRPGARNLKGAG